MSCRRSDRARFIGCHVGSVRIRGCSRECCPYPSSKVEENERWDYLSLSSAPGIRHDEQHPIDLTLAQSCLHSCKSPYKPKFLCLDCRRVFKLSCGGGNMYFPPGGEDNYRSGWWMSFREQSDWVPAWKIHIAQKELTQEQRDTIQSMIEQERYGTEPTRGTSFSEGEIAEMRKYSVDLRMRRMKRSCCPGCGKKGLPIGGAFRAPAKKDEKGWRRVREMLEEGERFSYCLTLEEEAELMQDVLAMRRLAS